MYLYKLPIIFIVQIHPVMMAPSGIDYSKWDQLDYGDSDSDESYCDGNKKGTTPRVTRLDAPSTIQTSAEDGSISIAKQAGELSSGTLPNKKIEFVKSVSNTGSNGTSKRTVLEILTCNGGHFKDTITNSSVFWSQDRHEVVLNVVYDASVYKAKDFRVDVKGAVPYSQRFSAVGTGTNEEGSGSILIESSDKRILLNGKLPHFVHLPENEEYFDWEIINPFDEFPGHPIDMTIIGDFPSTKLLRITMFKAVPMAGVTMWWSHPLSHAPEIDVNSIESRRSSDRQDKLKSVWKEAHDQFQAKLANGELHQPINIE